MQPHLRLHLRSSRFIWKSSSSSSDASLRTESLVHVWKWQRWITRCLIRGQFRYIMITIAMTGELPSSVPSLGRIWRADGADWRSAFVLAKNPCTAMKNTYRDFYNLIICLIISVWLMHVMPHDVYVCTRVCTWRRPVCLLRHFGLLTDKMARDVTDFMITS